MRIQIDDPNVALAAKAISTFDTEYAKEVAATAKALAASPEQAYATLPPEHAGSGQPGPEA